MTAAERRGETLADQGRCMPHALRQCVDVTWSRFGLGQRGADRVDFGGTERVEHPDLAELEGRWSSWTLMAIVAERLPSAEALMNCV